METGRRTRHVVDNKPVVCKPNQLVRLLSCQMQEESGLQLKEASFHSYTPCAAGAFLWTCEQPRSHPGSPLCRRLRWR